VKRTKRRRIFQLKKPALAGGRPVRENFLPAFKPFINDAEINEVIDTLKSGWITTGPKVKLFEEEVQEFIGSKHAIAVSSCTSALHLSLVAYGVGSGDEVITTPFTFASTINVIIHQGAKPVFVDIDRETYNIDVTRIEDNITEKTRAIIPVHYAGHPCEMDDLMEIAQKYDLIIIEDAAHAFSALYKGRKIGTIGHITCFSFYATKNLTTGEGGMITTNDDEVAEKVRMLRLHGMSRDAWKRYTSKGSWYYEVVYPGYKYNMTDIQAALGLAQLRKINHMQRRREEIAKMYNEAFDDLTEVIIPQVKDYVRHSWHLYPILLETNLLKINRNTFIEALKAENIGTSVHFIPIHLHPYYREKYGFKQGDFPNAEYVYEREISLPIYPSMTDEDVETVITAVKKIVEYFRK
jgi:UDP-4-amino-4,6-dideoxy-N-acetyl-beta-L-altrosamine transaminase